MKRGAPDDKETPDSKRSRVGNSAQNAYQTGSVLRNSEQYHMNLELSTLPEKTLYADTAELARSTCNTQATLGNSAIGAQWGNLRDGRVENKALPLALFDGAVAPSFPEIRATADDWPEQPDAKFMSVDGKPQGKPGRPTRRTRAEIEAGVRAGHWKQGDLDAAQYGNSQNGGGYNDDPKSGGFHSEPFQPKKETIDGKEAEEKDYAGHAAAVAAAAGGGGAGGAAAAGLTQAQLDWLRQNGGAPAGYKPPGGPPGGGGGGGGGGDDDEQKKKDEKEKEPESRYMAELRPFLPMAGSDIFRDSKPQQEAKALNLALFNNIIRNPGTGDPNVNPLQMGIVIQDSWRFSGDNKVFDYVLPGGSLNLGALPLGTERLWVPDNVLEAEHAKIVCARNVRNRMTAVNEYHAALQNAAARAMPMMQADVQWINNNKDVKDEQHVAWSNNTMPMEVDFWEYRPQIDGVVPLQDNLLPAQASQTNRTWDTKPSYIYNPTARSQSVFNPSMRFGWNPWTSFY